MLYLSKGVTPLREVVADGITQYGREIKMNGIFHLKESNTNVRTEILAGVTTFMTMAYIIALNPNLLTNFGAEGQNLPAWD